MNWLRGVSTIRWIDNRMLDALLAARRFKEARAFVASRPAPASRAIPTVVDRLGTAFSGRSLYRYHDASDTLTREAAPAPVGVQLVMIVQEHYEPSARALQALREDADLQAELRRVNLLLLTNTSDSIPFRFMSTWTQPIQRCRCAQPVVSKNGRSLCRLGCPSFSFQKMARCRAVWWAVGHLKATKRLFYP